MLSKLVAWDVNTPLHDVQRELIREQTRRLRLKTDLQEERIQKRKKREEGRKEADERFHHKATLIIKFRHGGKPAQCQIDMKQSKKARMLHFDHLGVEDDNGFIKRFNINVDAYAATKVFVCATEVYREVAETWLNGTIDLPEAKAMMKNYSKDRAELRVLNDLINKNKKS